MAAAAAGKDNGDARCERKARTAERSSRQSGRTGYLTRRFVFSVFGSTVLFKT